VWAGDRDEGRLWTGLLGLIRTRRFDMDGVLTETAKVHATAWKEMSDTHLKTRADKSA